MLALQCHTSRPNSVGQRHATDRRLFIKRRAWGYYNRYEVPDDVVFVTEIPMTSTGKLDKKNVRQLLKQQGYTLPSLR